MTPTEYDQLAVEMQARLEQTESRVEWTALPFDEVKTVDAIFLVGRVRTSDGVFRVESSIATRLWVGVDANAQDQLFSMMLDRMMRQIPAEII